MRGRGGWRVGGPAGDGGHNGDVITVAVLLFREEIQIDESEADKLSLLEVIDDGLIDWCVFRRQCRDELLVKVID